MRYLSFSLLAALTLALLISCGSGKKTQELEGITAEDMYQQGNVQLSTGKYEEALKTFKSLLERFPTTDLHIDTQLKIAQTYGKLDQFEEQMDLLLRLLRENIIPERIPKIYVQIGKFYERAAQFNPGVISTDTTDYQTAVDYYNKALKYGDSDDNMAKSEALYRRGLVDAKIGEINKAIEDYRSVTVIYPDYMFSLLAKIKLQNPEDTSELAVDDASIQSYKEILNIETTPADTQELGEETGKANETSGEDDIFTPPPTEDEGYEEENSAPADTTQTQE